MAALADEGVETPDWRPVRFAVTHPSSREVDLHPLIFSPDGSAVQASPDPEQPYVPALRGHLPAARTPGISAAAVHMLIGDPSDHRRAGSKRSGKGVEA